MGLVQSDTPMMQQFNALKQAHPDAILFFRAGDFYEMFGDDAVRAAEILNIALTARGKNSDNPVPMCGVPFHAYEQYLNRLTAAGVKVAIAEQMEEASQAKGVVRREVVRVVTPGTTLSEQLIREDRNNYLAAVDPRGAWQRQAQPVALALVDITTGLFEVEEVPNLEALLDLLGREQPREIILPEARGEREQAPLAEISAKIRERLGAVGEGVLAMEPVPAAWFEPGAAQSRLQTQFETANLDGFGVSHLRRALGAAGALLLYLEQTQKTALTHLTALRPRVERDAGGVMWLDDATLEHLELFDNRAPGGRRHTLFAMLNGTCTAMGARLLRRWLGAPLLDTGAIEARYDAVAELGGDLTRLERLQSNLRAVGDLERIVARVSLPTCGIADMVALRDTLGQLQGLPPLLETLQAAQNRTLAERFDPMSEVHDYLRARFLPEPSLKLAEGGYIADGVIGELDHLRTVSRDSRSLIAGLEAREREQTGIGSLKVRYNRVFGYYLEISKVHGAKVPAHYNRKQTLVNAERYTTLELQELEEQILGAAERIADLERQAFAEARTILGGYARRLQETARRIATLDVLAGLARTAQEHHYVRPTLRPLSEPCLLRIVGGRHPVIERLDFEERFIPNDTELDGAHAAVMVITGPNMAGKSTVMRQVALIQLMAQTGSFVPAEAAELSVVDRIFTRVGASDNLSRGQSTFMTEMNEAANILNNATPASLVVLDEIGRGTSTYDGISIAWAMVEHLHHLGALTLFATHYHELTQLVHELPRLRNYNMAIREEGERLVFTRKLQPGEADRSYGIQVARLAGLPRAVIERAHEVMASLTAGSEGEALVLAPPAAGGETADTTRAAQGRQQLSFLTDTHPLLEELRGLTVEDMTPLQALNWLSAAQRRLHQRDED